MCAAAGSGLGLASLPSLGLSSWAGGALAALEYAGVKGETVLCPSNTFMASPLAAIGAGAAVEFVDCNREDLCMSFEDFERKVVEAVDHWFPNFIP